MLPKPVRHEKHDLEWQPDLATEAPAHAEDVPERLRGVTLRRGRRARPPGMPWAARIVVLGVALAILVAVLAQVLGG